MMPVLTGLGAGLALLLVALVIRRAVQRRMFAGLGFEEWREVAAQLPWRDRRALYVANSRGRAPAPRLAPLAVRRGEVIEAMLLRAAQRRRPLRWVLYSAGVVSLAGLALTVTAYFMDDGGGSLWPSVPSTLLTAGIAFAYEPLVRRRAELVRRSVERSRELTS
jgi:hypothetical protein